MPLRSGLGSIKVSNVSTIRQIAYDFQLAFHISYGPIVYRFRDWSNIAFDALLDNPVEISPYFVWKTRMYGLPECAKSLRICLLVAIQYTNVTDGRTDRRTPRHGTGRAVTRYAYRRAVNTELSQNDAQRLQEMDTFLAGSILGFFLNA